MAGLALGSALFARLSPRLRNLIAAYGWMEIAIGLLCAAMPALLWAAAAVYVRLHDALGLSAGQFGLLQFTVIVTLLVVPTTLMGGTLPVLAQGLVGDERRVSGIGLLYAANTFGAVVGTVLAGYTLLPALGTFRTTMLAVAVNLVAGALGLLLSRGWRAAPAPAVTAPAGERWDRDQRITVLVFGLSGAVAMLYEVAWTRALTQILGSSTYAFTAMLVAYLLGIAGGSALYSWRWGGRPASAGTLATLLAAGAVIGAATVALFERLPEVFLLGLRVSDAPGFVQWLQLALSAAALLPATLAVGATFPCAVAAIARDPARMGEDVGRLYSANTLGCIAGVAIGGFLLVPRLGVQRALVVGVAVNLTLAAALWAREALRGPHRRWGPATACAAGAALVFLLPRWDAAVMTSGPAVYAKLYLEGGLPVGQAPRAPDVVYYRDGPSGTVSVHRAGEHVYLRVNGKIDAGTQSDMMTQLLSGHLPMLTHPAPYRVLVIGLGSGITVGAIARYPLAQLDVVEIEPAIVEASQHFAHLHGNVLADARVRTVVADGRSFLLTTRERYDVIVSEPSNPWIAGLASLFSTEFFELARSRLRPGGVMLQWIQGYGLPPEDLRMIVRTFGTAFPRTSVWGMRGDLLLMGRTDPAPLDAALVEERVRAVPGVLGDLTRLGLPRWEAPLGLFLLGEADVVRFAAGGRLNTDDGLPLEFSAPRALYVDTVPENRDHLRRFRTSDLPDVAPAGRAGLEGADARYWMGRAGIAVRDMDLAADHFRKSVAADPDHLGATLGLAIVALSKGAPGEALGLATRALARAPSSAEALFLAGLSAERLGRRPDALSYFERALTLVPDRPEYREAVRRLRAQH